jgi:hypothetical protein
MPPLRPRAAAVPALVLALAACHDTPTNRAAEPEPPRVPPVAAGELRVAIQLLDSAAGEARVALRLEHPGVRVGAYSGTARFDVAGVEVVDAVAAAGSGGLVNASTGEAGAVRFAGFDVAGVRSDVIATVRLRVRDWGALARTTTELTAAATDAGVAVEGARLRQARGVTIAAGGAR